MTVGSAQSVTVAATLVPEITSAHVTVRDQNGAPVNIFIDGQDKGAAPWEGELTAGEHTVEAKGTKFAADKRLFFVTRKQRLDLTLDATTTLGHLRIVTTPASASVLWDGQLVARGLWDADVAPGPHRLEVSLAGQPSVVRDVAVQRGQLIAQDVTVGSSASEPLIEYRGVYAKLDAFAMISPSTVNEFTTGENLHGRYGGGLGLRIGYNFGLLGVEFVTAAMFDRDDQNPASSSKPVQRRQRRDERARRVLRRRRSNHEPR